MALSLGERVAVAALAKLLYDFLPASGNGSTSFPLAAAKVGIPEAWPQGKPSKEPGIIALLVWTLENRRGKFCSLIQEVVLQSITWRGRSSTPLTREEIVELNRLLLGVSFKIPELHSPAFLDSLPTASPPAPAAAATPRLVEEAVYVDLQRHLIALSGLE
ncbi:MULTISPECIES: hypothetical protein, partial [Stenotrophomonas]|uniref:hypothetical protein n=1 Tax=Stenotrophomonas TaxID=40323 RepID=UPI001C404DA2